TAEPDGSARLVLPGSSGLYAACVLERRRNACANSPVNRPSWRHAAPDRVDFVAIGGGHPGPRRIEPGVLLEHGARLGAAPRSEQAARVARGVDRFVRMLRAELGDEYADRVVELALCPRIVAGQAARFGDLQLSRDDLLLLRREHSQAQFQRTLVE